MKRASIFVVSWVIAVLLAATALPFAYTIDFSSPQLRIGVTSLLVLLAGCTAWVKAKVDRLQESESADEDDEDFLYYAASRLQREVWTLLGIYVTALLLFLVSTAIGSDDTVGRIVAVFAYLMITLSVCSMAVLRNIDVAASREIYARKKKRHIRKERKEQRQRLESDEELPPQIAEHLRDYNKPL